MDDNVFSELAFAGREQQRSNDDGLAVTFTEEPILDEEASKRAGRKIFRTVEYVEVRIPGDLDVRRDIVTDDHRERFRRRYDLWKASNKAEVVEGLPLAEWPAMTKAQVYEARAVGIHSVQHLAHLSDVAVQKLGPGWTTMRQKAKDYLAAEEKAAPMVAMRNLIAEQETRIRTLEAMLAKQAKELQGGSSVTSDVEERMKAALARLEAAQAPAVPDVPKVTLADAAGKEPANGAPKRRGRPPGSKNKPKPAAV